MHETINTAVRLIQSLKRICLGNGLEFLMTLLLGVSSTTIYAADVSPVTVKFYDRGREFFFRTDKTTGQRCSTRQFHQCERYDYQWKRPDDDSGYGLPPSYDPDRMPQDRQSFNGWRIKGGSRVIGSYEMVDPNVTELETDWISYCANTQYFMFHKPSLTIGISGDKGYSGSAEESQCGEHATLFLPVLNGLQTSFDNFTIANIDPKTKFRIMTGLGSDSVNEDLSVWLEGYIYSYCFKEIDNGEGETTLVEDEITPEQDCSFDIEMVVVMGSGRTLREKVADVTIPTSKFHGGLWSDCYAFYKIRHVLPKTFFQPGEEYTITYEINPSGRAPSLSRPSSYSNVTLYENLGSWSTNAKTFSADYSKGELSISWDPQKVDYEDLLGEFLDKATYSVWRTTEDWKDIDDFSTMICLNESCKATSFTDKTFGTIRGTKNVYYLIVLNGGPTDARYDKPVPYLSHIGNDSILARDIYYLSIGCNEYAPRKYFENGEEKEYVLSENEYNSDEAGHFETLVNKMGDAVRYGVFLNGPSTRKNVVTKQLKDICERTKPGDTVFFYIGTHGYKGMNDSEFALNLYDERYSVTEMAGDISELNVKGVKFIGLINACYSGGFITHFKSMINTAWIASTDFNHSSWSFEYASWAGSPNHGASLFGTIFLRWGWEEYYAKKKELMQNDGRMHESWWATDDKYLSLFEIANYAKYLILGASSIGRQYVTIVNEDLLKCSDIAEDVSPPEMSAQSVFSLSVEPPYEGSVQLTVSNLKAPYGMITYAPVNNEGWTSWFMETQFSSSDFTRALYSNKTPKEQLPTKKWRNRLEWGVKYKFCGCTIDRNGFGPMIEPVYVTTLTLLEFIMRDSNKISLSRQYDLTGAKGSGGGNILYIQGLGLSTDGDWFVEVGLKDNRGEEICSKLAHAKLIENAKDKLTVILDNVEIQDGITFNGTFSLCGTLEEVTAQATLSGDDVSGAWDMTIKGQSDTYGDFWPEDVFDETECPFECLFSDFGTKFRKVSFDANGGVVPEKVRAVADSTKVCTLPVPTWNGYVFSGWWTDPLGGERITETNVISADVICYAHWLRDDDYAFVTFDLNGGMAAETNLVVRKGTKITTIPVPIRENYLFVGWFTEQDKGEKITFDTLVDADVIYYAHWQTDRLCTVTFDPDSDFGMVFEETRKVLYDTEIGPLPVPKSNGNEWSKYFVFDGWYTEPYGGVKVTAATKVIDDVTYYAHWEYKSNWSEDDLVIVSAVVAEGSEAMGRVSGGGKAVKAGTKVTLKATANKGYVFVEWRDAEGAVVSQSASYTCVAKDEDVTLTAVFATAAADEESLKVTVEDMATEADGTIGTEDADGTRSLDLGAYVESLSQPKLTVSGLPAGLKYDAKTMKITGKATKPGVYTVKVTASNASATGKKAVVETFNITVPNFRWNEETVGVALEDKYLLQAGVTPALSNEVAAITGAGWKLAVSGLPSGVKFDAKKGVFTGVATKDGFYTVYFTATRGKGKTAEKQVATATFEVVFPTLSLKVAAYDDGSATNKATVTGGGKYPFGKKVTLKATAAKGKVFRGWYDDEGGLVAQTVSYPYVTTDEDVALTAVFVTTQEDKASITANVDGWELAPWVSKTETHAFATNVWAGVYLEWPIEVDALSLPTVKVSGLPAGLKFAAKPVTSKVGTGKAAVTVTNVAANTIYGAPTAASKTVKDKKTGVVSVTPSAVKVTVTTAGKSSQTYQIDTTVDPLPAWAQGTFAGGSQLAATEAGAINCAPPVGTVSLTVSAAGKVSGKAQGEFAYTLAAPYYSGFAAEPVNEGVVSNFLADVTASWSYKIGSKTVKTNDVVQMTVRDNGVGGVAETALPGDDGGQGLTALPDWTAWQYNWKGEPWKTLGKSFDKVTLPYAILADGSFLEGEEALMSALGADVTGRVTLKFSAKGAVTVTGEFVSGYDEKKKKYTTVKASGSATLVPVDDDQGAVFIYLTPKGLPPHARSLDVPWPEE